MSEPRPPAPDLPTILSFALLAVLAVLLLLPVFTGVLPSPLLVGALLLARLGLQVWRARRDERLRRPAAWALDLILIGLIFSTLSRQPGG